MGLNPEDEVAIAARRLHIRPEAVRTYLDAGRGVRGDGVERRFHTTVKPVGSACNLRCSYCYYLGKDSLLDPQAPRLMSDALLERFIVDYVAAQDADEIVFTWHGGEPTLAGLPFFRRVVELERKHAPAGRRIANDLQTNGMLLDDEWCQFLSANGFLVGLSVDGPRELHDRNRTARQGGSSFDGALAAARRLRAHGIPWSVLATVNRDTGRHPVEVYRCLRDEVGARNLQLIPCVEPRDFDRAPAAGAGGDRVSAQDPRARPGHPESVVTPWSVDPDDWGRFLVAVFDEWSAHDRGRVKVNLFESLFAVARGQPAIVCSQAPLCGKNIALERDGRVFSCDHFVYREHELGRLDGERTLAAMMFSLPQLAFGLRKLDTLPSECRTCGFLELCWGECPRTRILWTRAGEGPASYLCAGWKSFFRQRLAALVGDLRGARPAPRRAGPRPR